jgi:hypothetical protein
VDKRRASDSPHDFVILAQIGLDERGRAANLARPARFESSLAQTDWRR